MTPGCCSRSTSKPLTPRSVVTSSRATILCSHYCTLQWNGRSSSQARAGNEACDTISVPSKKFGPTHRPQTTESTTQVPRVATSISSRTTTVWCRPSSAITYYSLPGYVDFDPPPLFYRTPSVVFLPSIAVLLYCVLVGVRQGKAKALTQTCNSVSILCSI